LSKYLLFGSRHNKTNETAPISAHPGNENSASLVQIASAGTAVASPVPAIKGNHLAGAGDGKFDDETVCVDHYSDV
jgi:hypothetical protein